MNREQERERCKRRGERKERVKLRGMRGIELHHHIHLFICLNVQFNKHSSIILWYKRKDEHSMFDTMFVCYDSPLSPGEKPLPAHCFDFTAVIFAFWLILYTPMDNMFKQQKQIFCQRKKLQKNPLDATSPAQHSTQKLATNLYAFSFPKSN